MRLPIIIATGLAVAAPTGVQAAKNPYAKVMQLTDAEARARVTVADSSLSTIVTVSSQPVAHTKGLIPMGDSDVWLLAGIDARSGATAFQVAATVSYWGRWAFFRSADYSTAGDPVSADLESVRRDVVTCMHPAGCKYQESGMITVSEDVLRGIASGENAWRIRFNGDGGPLWAEAVSPVEVTAFLAAVDRVRNTPR